MSATEVTVPDIGDFSEVEIIEILVKPGDSIKAEQSLVTVESDKASMEIPSSTAGKVLELKVKLGDKVKQGSLLALVEPSAAAAKPATSTVPPAAPATASAGPVPANPDMANETASQAGAPAAPPAQAAASAAVEVVVPDIGDFDQVEVIEVLIKPGDQVKKDQSLITLESDKASMEIPSSADGVVSEVMVKVGDKVARGALIAKLSGVSAAGATPAQSTPSSPQSVAQSAVQSAPQAAPQAAPEVAPQAAPEAAPKSSPHSGSQATPEASAAQPSPVPAPVAAREPSATPAEPSRDTSMPVAGLPHASPSVRQFARELGVDLKNVSGSAGKGRITREDVQNFVKATLAAGPAAPAAPAAKAGNSALTLMAWPSLDFSKFGATETVALSRIKKISGPNLARNWAMIPHVTQFDEADVTELEAFRKATNEKLEKGATKVTMLAFVMKACVTALRRLPNFNSSLDADGSNLILKKYVHIGFAADTPNGLVVPVIRDCDQKSITQLAKETAELAGKAREGKLSPSEMQGASFTISSLGGVGGTAFTPIINAPEVAILGLSRADIKPHWDGNSFVPRLKLPLCLSYDHRVIDGAQAARFTTLLGELLSDMRRVLL